MKTASGKSARNARAQLQCKESEGQTEDRGEAAVATSMCE